MIKWVIEKGKGLIFSIVNRNIEKEMKPDVIKKAAIPAPKINTEPVKWPLPTKR